MVWERGKEVKANATDAVTATRPPALLPFFLGPAHAQDVGTGTPVIYPLSPIPYHLTGVCASESAEQG